MQELDKMDIRGLINREPKQIYQLIKTYSDCIYHVCLSYVYDQRDAEELTQDVFMACLQSIKTYKARSSLKTWLYRIAVNKSIDFLKHRNRKKRNVSVVPIDNYSIAEYGEKVIDYCHPGVQLESQEKINSLFYALDQLPPRQKTPLTLMKLNGKSQTEVSTIMELGEKAVESLVQRARKSLR